MIRVISLVGCLWLIGCSQPESPATNAQGAEEIYSRQHIRFAHGVLFKPAKTDVQDLVFKFAPLFILQVSDTNLTSQIPDGLINAGAPMNSAQSAVVSTWADAVELREQLHPRLSYVWNHPAPGTPFPKACVLQGVRITLGTNGQPMIWEILADTSGRDLIVVSESLEQAAAQQFGPPLPGRRFAIETATNTSLNTVVMRIIDDGPVAMGPILYLEKGTRNVSTLICRCMPAQAGNLADTRNYELVSAPPESTRWPALPLGTRLRLPDF